jgi:hypothetical protein
MILMRIHTRQRRQKQNVKREYSSEKFHSSGTNIEDKKNFKKFEMDSFEKIESNLNSQPPAYSSSCEIPKRFVSGPW